MRTIAGGNTHLFGHDDLLPNNLSGYDTLQRLIAGSPVKLVQAVMPVLLQAMDEARLAPLESDPPDLCALAFDAIWAHGSPYLERLADQLLSAVTDALVRLTTTDPDFVREEIEMLSESDLVTAQLIVASVLAKCPVSFLDAMRDWAARTEVRGVASLGSAGWGWGDVLARIVEVGSEDDLSFAVESVLAPYRDLDLDVVATVSMNGNSDEAIREYRLAHQQHAAATSVLKALRNRDFEISDELAVRLTALDSLVGELPEHPGPVLLGGWGSSPLSGEPTPNSDAEWIAAIDAYDPSADPFPGVGRTGWVIQQLVGEARSAPERFAALIPALQSANRSRAAAAIFLGASQAPELSAIAVQQITSAMRVAWSWEERPEGEVALVIDRLSVLSLDEDLLEMLSWIVANASDPPGEPDANGEHSGPMGDIVTASLNCVRGRALVTTARVLAGPSGPAFATQVVASLRSAAHDPAGQVRVQVPGALVQLARFDEQLALEIFTEWLSTATDDVLRSPDLNRFVYRMRVKAPGMGVEVVDRLLGSEEGALQNSAGYLVAHLAWADHDLDLTGTFGSRVRAALGSPASRSGVALALTEFRDELPNDFDLEGPRLGMRLLVALIDDVDDEVRAASITAVHRFNGDLAPFARFFAALADCERLAAFAHQLFFALKEATKALPVEVLRIIERWFEVAGSTAEGGDTYGSTLYATEVVLNLHAQFAVGSDDRARCLDIFDHLIVMGANDIERSLDDAVS